MRKALFVGMVAATLLLTVSCDNNRIGNIPEDKYQLTVVVDSKYGTVTGSGVYTFGDKVNIAFTPTTSIEDLDFKGWKIEDTYVETALYFVYTMPSKPVTINCIVKEKEVVLNEDWPLEIRQKMLELMEYVPPYIGRSDFNSIDFPSGQNEELIAAYIGTSSLIEATAIVETYAAILEQAGYISRQEASAGESTYILSITKTVNDYMSSNFLCYYGDLTVLNLPDYITMSDYGVFFAFQGSIFFDTNKAWPQKIHNILEKNLGASIPEVKIGWATLRYKGQRGFFNANLDERNVYYELATNDLYDEEIMKDCYTELTDNDYKIARQEGGSAIYFKSIGDNSSITVQKANITISSIGNITALYISNIVRSQEYYSEIRDFYSLPSDFKLPSFLGSEVISIESSRFASDSYSGVMYFTAAKANLLDKFVAQLSECGFERIDYNDGCFDYKEPFMYNGKLSILRLTRGKYIRDYYTDEAFDSFRINVQIVPAASERYSGWQADKIEAMFPGLSLTALGVSENTNRTIDTEIYSDRNMIQIHVNGYPRTPSYDESYFQFYADFRGYKQTLVDEGYINMGNSSNHSVIKIANDIHYSVLIKDNTYSSYDYGFEGSSFPSYYSFTITISVVEDAMYSANDASLFIENIPSFSKDNYDFQRAWILSNDNYHEKSCSIILPTTENPNSATIVWSGVSQETYDNFMRLNINESGWQLTEDGYAYNLYHYGEDYAPEDYDFRNNPFRLLIEYSDETVYLKYVKIG